MTANNVGLFPVHPLYLIVVSGQWVLLLVVIQKASFPPRVALPFFPWGVLAWVFHIQQMEAE